MNYSLLKFQIGPVQEFIAQARSTRDLWSGSWLLSHLTRTGAQVVASASGAELLYPVLDEKAARLAASTPNLFLARVPADDAAKLAEAVDEAIRKEWRKIAELVHNLICQHASAGWDAGWHQQVERFPTVDWIIHPCSADADALALLQKGVPPLPANAPNFRKPDVCLDGLHIALADWKFAAMKNARSFAVWKGTPAPKDNLDGFREVMGGSDHEAFWRGLRSQERFKHTLKGQQLYGAMTLIKRLFPDAYLGDKPGFDSVQHIAAAIDAEEGEVPHGSPTYYAILAMDGDDMGQWVSGCKGVYGDLDPLQPGYQGKLSAKLSTFASAVPAIMARHAGQAIYCGGDDVLAMLPARHALACAQDLAKEFAQALPGGTASVGIVIGHVRSPLQDTIQAAREAEKTAKAVPHKNAFSVRILKRSGESAEFAARFDSGIVVVWDELNHEVHDLTGRFAYRYLQILKPLLSRSDKDADNGWEPKWTSDLIEICQAELRHTLSQQGKQKAEKAKANAERWIKLLIGTAENHELTPAGYLHFWMAWAFVNRISNPQN